MNSVFKKGYMYKVSCKPEVLVYVAESKTLAGAEVRMHEGEASGRKLVVVFYTLDDRGLAHRVDSEDLHVKHVLLALAELLQALDYVLPVDPERTAATGELMLEAAYQVLEVCRASHALWHLPQDNMYMSLEMKRMPRRPILKTCCR